MKVDQTSFSGVTFDRECNGHTRCVIQCIRATSTFLSLRWSWSVVDDSPVRREISINLFRSSATNQTKIVMASKRKRQATNKETDEGKEPKMNLFKSQNQRYAKQHHHSIEILIGDSSTVFVRIFSSELSISSKPFETVSSALFESEHRIERFVFIDALPIDFLEHAEYCNVDCDAERPINRHQTDESVVVDDHS